MAVVFTLFGEPVVFIPAFENSVSVSGELTLSSFWNCSKNLSGVKVLYASVIVFKVDDAKFFKSS
jgi:hypothetical protein